MADREREGERISDEEAMRRMNEALKRALDMPPKLHRKPKAGKKVKPKHGARSPA